MEDFKGQIPFGQFIFENPVWMDVDKTPAKKIISGKQITSRSKIPVASNSAGKKRIKLSRSKRIKIALIAACLILTLAICVLYMVIEASGGDIDSFIMRISSNIISYISAMLQ